MAKPGGPIVAADLKRTHNAITRGRLSCHR
jgi:hypothetical protein